MWKVWHVVEVCDLVFFIEFSDYWVKKCMDYEVEGPRPRGRPKRTWKEVVREDCKTHKLNKVDGMDSCKWRKVLKAVRWLGWVCGWVFLLVPAYPGSPGTKAIKRLLLFQNIIAHRVFVSECGCGRVVAKSMDSDVIVLEWLDWRDLFKDLRFSRSQSGLAVTGQRRWSL